MSKDDYRLRGESGVGPSGPRDLEGGANPDGEIFSFEYGPEWAEAGFSEEEAKLWHSYRFTPQGARRWAEFPPSLAFVCAILGYSPERAKRWADCGFALDFHLVPLWEKNGFAPQEAAKWRQLDCDPWAARKLKSQGYTPETYAEKLAKLVSKGSLLDLLLFRAGAEGWEEDFESVVSS